MANSNVKEYILRTVYDGNGHKNFIKNQQTLNSVLEQANLKFTKNTKVLNTSISGFDKLNPTSGKFFATIRQGNGPIEKLSANVELVNGKLVPIEGSLKRTTIATKGLADGSKSLSETMLALGKRALATIVIWTTLRAVIQKLFETVKNAVKFMVEFETQLAQVQIVGGKTTEEINKLASGVLEVGARFGVSFEQMGEAMKLWAQQGKSVTEILDLMGPTMQLSLVSGRSLSDVVEDLTAVTTSYNIEASNSIDVVDKITRVMLTHAITANDLAAGLRRLTPVTSQFNISLEESIGLITAIQVQTRRGGATVGDALRTILTRLQGPEFLQGIQDLSKIPVFLDEAGNATSEFTSKLRPAQAIIADLAAAFDTFDVSTKNAVGNLAAGRRRVTEFLALMNNFKEEVNATADAFFSTGKAFQATDIITETTASKFQQLSNTFKQLLENFRGPTTKVLGDVADVLKYDINQINSLIDPSGTQNRDLLASLGLDQQETKQQISALNGLVGAMGFLEDANERINTNIAIATERGNSALAESFKKQSEVYVDAVRVAFSKADKETQKQITDLVGRDFLKGDTNTILNNFNKNLDKVLFSSKESQLKIDLIEIKKSIVEADQNLKNLERDKSKAENGFFGKVDEASLKKIEDAIVKQKIETQILKAEEQEINKILSDRTKLEKEAQDQKKANDAARKEVETYEQLKVILSRIKNLRTELTDQGLSEAEINKRLLNELQTSIDKAQIDRTSQSTKNALSPFLTKEKQRQNQEAIVNLQSKENLLISQSIALGKNEIQLQQVRVAFAREKLKFGGDSLDVLKEELRLQELVNEQIANASQELQGAFSSAFSDLLKGQSTVDEFLNNITNKIRDRITDAVAESFTDFVFQTTGFGNIFGSLVTSIENSGSLLASQLDQSFTSGSTQINNALVTGGQAVATAITGAFQQQSAQAAAAQTAQSAQSASSSTSGISSNLLSLFQSGGGNRPAGSDQFVKGSLVGVRDNGTILNTTGNQSSSLFGGAGGLARTGGSVLSAIAAVQQARQGNTGGAALSGALAGSRFGGYGAIIGGAIGFVSAALSSKNKTTAEKPDQGLFGLGFGIGLTEQTRNIFGQNGGKAFVQGLFDPFGVFTGKLFRKSKPKRTIDIQEETKDLRTASKIDITNKKLDIVNRNLVALRQDFRTFILPESVAFSTKRNLEDQFSINASRGLS